MSALAQFFLEHELSLWRKAGHQPILWWRDDDARVPSPALDRLLAVRADLPISLAVIPDCDLAPLSARLIQEAGLAISQHGVDHQNRRAQGEKRSEYPWGTTLETKTQSILQGQKKLEAVGLAPAFYTPPWNSFDESLLAALRSCGYRIFSAGIYGKPSGEIDHVGAELDVLRWKHEPPKFKGKRRIFAALRAQLERRRKKGQWAEPIGILTHHLVHDDATWDFLAWFVEWSKRRVSWRSIAQIRSERLAA